MQSHPTSHLAVKTLCVCVFCCLSAKEEHLPIEVGTFFKFSFCTPLFKKLHTCLGWLLHLQYKFFTKYKFCPCINGGGDRHEYSWKMYLTFVSFVLQSLLCKSFNLKGEVGQKNPCPIFFFFTDSSRWLGGFLCFFFIFC